MLLTVAASLPAFVPSPLTSCALTSCALTSRARSPHTHAPLMADVDVSDLSLTMADLEVPLELGSDADIETRGVESSSVTAPDDGIEWSEAALGCAASLAASSAPQALSPSSHPAPKCRRLTARLRIPGLRGQPAASLAVEFTESTMTITAFGRGIWSCVLRGAAAPSRCRFEVEDGLGALATITVAVSKADASGDRWNGLVESIGVDSVLQ